MNNQVKWIIIHHSGISYNKNPNQFDAINNYHKKLGWGQIGYHFLIEKDGSLYGYPDARGQDQVGAHCVADGMNNKSLGICLTGNFEIEQPAEKQLITLRNLVDQLKKAWDIPTENVLGHNEVNGAKVICPGKNIIKEIQSFRNTSPQATVELLRTIKELRQGNGQLKQKNTKLTTKLTNAKNVIKELKVAIESKKTWTDKLLELIKKNENE